MSEPPRLILASNSPRRAKLLRDAGYRFEQVSPPFDDSGVAMPGLSPRQLVAALAYQKAAATAGNLDGGIVLGCDTLLSLDGRAIGKPADLEEARSILTLIVGRSHQVVTGVALLSAADRRQKLFVESSEVALAPLPDEVLESYLRSERWRGKAGGYNLAELENPWRFTVTGDPTTVVGLPMLRLAEELRAFAPELLPAPK